MLSHYPYSYRALLPRLADLLAKGGEGDEWHARHKGALYIMLGPRAGPLVAKQDWDVVRTLWPAILKAPLSEKPSILRWVCWCGMFLFKDGNWIFFRWVYCRKSFLIWCVDHYRRYIARNNKYLNTNNNKSSWRLKDLPNLLHWR